MTKFLTSSVFRDTLFGFEDVDAEDAFQASCPLSAAKKSGKPSPCFPRLRRGQFHRLDNSCILTATSNVQVQVAVAASKADAVADIAFFLVSLGLAHGMWVAAAPGLAIQCFLSVNCIGLCRFILLGSFLCFTYLPCVVNAAV